MTAKLGHLASMILRGSWGLLIALAPCACAPGVQPSDRPAAASHAERSAEPEPSVGPGSNRAGPSLGGPAPLVELRVPEHLAAVVSLPLGAGFGYFQEWNVAVAQRFARQGGERVLLACGRARCVEQARTTAHYLELGGLTARVLYAQGAGHSYGGPMEVELHRAFEWVISGDSRW